jgi:hypothetical protein
VSVYPDFVKIAKEMRRASSFWYNAKIEIFDPRTRDLEWDVMTNTYSNSPETLLWKGSARVQPFRRPILGRTSFSQSDIKEVRFQLEYSEEMPDFRPGMRVRVVESDVEHTLLDFVYIIKTAVNSSYGWNRTIECEADLSVTSYE